ALGAALLYLDANEVLYLARGKAVFRSAMRIHLHAHASRRKFAFMDYALLRLHYRDKAVQIHVMAEYAKLALENMKAALRFVQDYFSLQWQAFAKRYFSGREAVLQLATSEDAHRRIYLDLANPAQQEIVSAPPHDSLLVLAGPGSGKTRVIVHRVAWLLRQQMVQPEEIMVL
ncbi:UvrD-helicase domain-containing protein, partial [Bacillus cereus group sp. TH230-1LC]|nr:UvrD-helicase domain-containing protein [Bacillus cereus group sp. TH230-1LC]